MPEIKVKHVVTFSSEDTNFPAENLLKSAGTSKWKSKSVGEKHVSVTLQLEKSSQIHQVDIGNEGSAFVEVLVGREATKEEDFQVLIVSSMFMSPPDSKANKNPNQVRIFGPDKLHQEAKNQKWDKIKIICTQPFNKNIQYGLSFVKFHGPPEPGEEKADAPKTPVSLGGFKVKSEEDDTIKAGSLFASRGAEKPAGTPLTGAAAARAASRLAEDVKVEQKTPPSLHRTHTPEQGMKRKHTDEAEAGGSKSRHEKDERRHSKDDRHKRDEKHSRDDRHSKDDRHSSHSKPHKQSSTSSRDSPPPMKKVKSESEKPRHSKTEKPFNRLMEKVVFVLSGFQNPLRGEIRDRAIDMGAKYKGNWEKGCTHLICAFANTPKYNEVKGKGRIVSQDWIDKCHKRKTLLPWRKYRLGNARSPPGTDESDVSEDETPTPKLERKPSSTASTPKPAEPPKKKEPVYKEDSDTDVDEDSDEGDTDDEIRRIQEAEKKQEEQKKKKKRAGPQKGVVFDPFDAPTDEEMSENEAKPSAPEKNGRVESDDDGELPELPDFFTSKAFFLYGDYAAADRRTLVRFITAYNGSLEEYMGNNVNFVISSKTWDDNFDDALADNPSLVFVKPAWVHACHEKQKLVPHQKYTVVPL